VILLDSSRTAIRPIMVKVAVLTNQFPADYSGDPCDRLIVATALAGAMASRNKRHENPRLQTDQDYLVSADQELSAPHFFAFSYASWLHKAKELSKEEFSCGIR
jgi:hypothetical protein